MAKDKNSPVESLLENENLNQDFSKIKIIRYTSHDMALELQKYAEAKAKGAPEADSNFNDYIKATNPKYKNDPDAIVVADLSKNIFESIEIQGADLSGCIIKDTIFRNADLSGVVFCDANLRNVKFDEGTTLTDVDFRGVDLSDVRFDKSYDELIDPKHKDAAKIKGLKFSSTEKLFKDYLRENAEVDKAFEKEHARISAMIMVQEDTVYDTSRSYFSSLLFDESEEHKEAKK